MIKEGVRAITLVSGYGGLSGEVLYVVGKCEKYIHLASSQNSECEYLCSVGLWEKDLQIV